MTDSLDFELSLYPDPVLRKVAEPVKVFDAELERIVAGMFARMQASKGVGLAAPQVGLRKRILVLNPTGEPEDALALVNVEILERSGPATLFDEGCLSFPGIYAEIERPDRCRVRASDPLGNPIEREFEGFTSRIVQHEYDHLEGILLVDRMSPADKVRHKIALEELIADYKAARSAEPSRRR
jgi:peptide deformylase